MCGEHKSLITNLLKAGAATQVLEGEKSSSEQLSAVHYVFSLYSGNALGLHGPRVKVKHFVNSLELIGILSTVAPNLLAENFRGEALGQLKIEAWRRKYGANYSHPHFRSLELET